MVQPKKYKQKPGAHTRGGGRQDDKLKQTKNKNYSLYKNIIPEIYNDNGVRGLHVYLNISLIAEKIFSSADNLCKHFGRIPDLNLNRLIFG